MDLAELTLLYQHLVQAHVTRAESDTPWLEHAELESILSTPDGRVEQVNPTICEQSGLSADYLKVTGDYAANSTTYADTLLR